MEEDTLKKNKQRTIENLRFPTSILVTHHRITYLNTIALQYIDVLTSAIGLHVDSSDQILDFKPMHCSK